MEEQSQEKPESDRQDDAGAGILRGLLKARNINQADTGRAPQLPIQPQPTPAQAASNALSRAADRLHRLPLRVDEAVLGGMTLAELPELLPEGALLAVLQGAGDAMGTVALCFEAVTSLIEIQSLGRVTSREIQKRAFTRGDALMCADFVNAFLQDLAEELGTLPGFDGIGDFRYASYLTDPRPLALILEDKPYRNLRFRLSLGAEQERQAEIFLALPLAAISPGSEDREHDGVSQETRAVPTLPKPAASRENVTLRDSVSRLPIEVAGILCRRNITLGKLRAFAPDQILSLPRADLSDVQLELPDGTVLARGKLGEAAGCHAIRLRAEGQEAQKITGSLTIGNRKAAVTLESGDESVQIATHAADELSPPSGLPDLNMEFSANVMELPQSETA